MFCRGFFNSYVREESVNFKRSNTDSFQKEFGSLEMMRLFPRTLLLVTAFCLMGAEFRVVDGTTIGKKNGLTYESNKQTPFTGGAFGHNESLVWSSLYDG